MIVCDGIDAEIDGIYTKKLMAAAWVAQAVVALEHNTFILKY